MRHIFTVDLEEYFQAHAVSNVVGRGEWDCLPPRVQRVVPSMLDLLDELEIRATFFVLGWVADRYPDLVCEVARRGHEVASHGWSHRRVDGLSVEEFRREVATSRELLEDLTGAPVRGFRAPSFSVVPGTEWALEVLAEEGYEYDSSIFPVRRPGYGYPGGQRDPHVMETSSGDLLELPPATRQWLGLRVPAAGGAYLRHLPFALVRGALREAADRRVPGVFYIHSWEVDEEMPRLPVGLVAERRHYGGIHRVPRRIRRLAEEFSFTSVERYFGLGEGPAERGQVPELPPYRPERVQVG